MFEPNHYFMLYLKAIRGWVDNYKDIHIHVIDPRDILDHDPAKIVQIPNVPQMFVEDFKEIFFMEIPKSFCSNYSILVQNPNELIIQTPSKISEQNVCKAIKDLLRREYPMFL